MKLVDTNEVCLYSYFTSPEQSIATSLSAFLRSYIQCVLCMHISACNVLLLDIYRQLACMKIGSRGKYQPMQYCWVDTSWLLGYLVHTCHLPIDIQQIYCSTQTGQHSRLQRSCCPVWVLQPIHAVQPLCYNYNMSHKERMP